MPSAVGAVVAGASNICDVEMMNAVVDDVSEVPVGMISVARMFLFLAL